MTKRDRHNTEDQTPSERKVRFLVSKLGPDWLFRREVAAKHGVTVALRFDRDMGPEAEVMPEALGFGVEVMELPVEAWRLYRNSIGMYAVWPCVRWEGELVPMAALPGPPHFIIQAPGDDGADELYREAEQLNRVEHG